MQPVRERPNLAKHRSGGSSSVHLASVPERHPRLAGLSMRQRNYWVVVANVAVIAALAGCSDNTFVAPTAQQSAASDGAPVSMMMAPQDRPSLSLSGSAPSNTTADFTVGPQGGVFFIGNHAVVFPKKSICDPARSTYGDWDAACKTIGKPIRIHAVVRNENGRSWVDFSPELRFAPSADPSRWVWMYMYTPDARGAQGDLSRFNILYAQSIGGVTVDDAASDATLRTYVDTRTGVLVRRIKHFSGYTAWAGRTCDDSSGSCGDSSITGGL
jgi:hypothetical protein